MNYYLAIAPELMLVALMFIMLGYNSLAKEADGRTSGLITAWGAFIILAITVVLAIVFPGQYYENGNIIQDAYEPLNVWGRTIVNDPIGLVFRVMFLIALILTSLLSLDHEPLVRGEYFALLLASTIGFNLMAVSADLIMLLVALETASISLYLLAGFASRTDRSTEAGMKYFIYGSFASALLLFGLSFLYGLTGQTNLYDIAAAITADYGSLNASARGSYDALIIIITFLLIAGFGFKISAVPFQWWTPDVYQGAPTPVTGFMSTASKAAGFALLMRVFTSGALGEVSYDNPWWALLVAIAIVTLFVGNMVAIWQTNIKRMLAYSSIGQAGYVLIGMLTLTSEGAGAAMFYLLMYVVTNIAAFGAITFVATKTGADDMTDLYGLSRRSPWLALCMLLALLSLGGIPPTAGFFGKFFIFKAAVEADLWWLALIGILMAFVSLYYYLNIIKYIYLYGKDAEHEKGDVTITRAGWVAMGLSVAGILYLGILAGPAFRWTQDAAQWFFPG